MLRAARYRPSGAGLGGRAPAGPAIAGRYGDGAIPPDASTGRGEGGEGRGWGGLQGLSAGPRPPLAVVPPRPAPRARCACARRCCAVRAPRRPRRGRRLSAAASALLGPGPRRARHGRPPPQADQDQSRRRQAVSARLGAAAAAIPVPRLSRWEPLVAVGSRCGRPRAVPPSVARCRGCPCRSRAVVGVWGPCRGPKHPGGPQGSGCPAGARLLRVSKQTWGEGLAGA